MKFLLLLLVFCLLDSSDKVPAEVKLSSSEDLFSLILQKCGNLNQSVSWAASVLVVRYEIIQSSLYL